MNEPTSLEKAMMLNKCPAKGVEITYRMMVDGTYQLEFYRENLSKFPDHRIQDVIVWGFQIADALTAGGQPTALVIIDGGMNDELTLSH